MAVQDKTVMIVEDHAFQRGILARMLTSLDVRAVIEAGNGRDAMALLNDPAVTQPEIVICDLDMPEMDGMEFIRHLGEIKSGVSLVILSALGRELLGSVENMARAYGMRMLGVMKKPVSLEQLQAMLDKHVPPSDERYIPVDILKVDLQEIDEGLLNQEFEAFFQPKVSFSSRRLVGAEALARWRHPQHGMVGPSVFIPLLEQSGRMGELTFLMLTQAAHACQGWLRQGLDISVSVNLSSVSLSDTSLAERILDAVRSTGLDPGHMILEITETAAMSDIAPVLENLTRLSMRGFGLSIDDYGTGFSSMQQLARIPFNELKIDRSFVTDIATHPAAHKIVQSSVNLARELSIKSVAEGVETQEDWDALGLLGCDIVQGYFIAKPMDAEAFLAFSHNWMAA